MGSTSCPIRIISPLLTRVRLHSSLHPDLKGDYGANALRLLGGLSSGESEQQEGEVDVVIVNAAVNKIKKVKMMRSESFVMDIMKRRTS